MSERLTPEKLEACFAILESAAIRSQTEVGCGRQMAALREVEAELRSLRAECEALRVKERGRFVAQIAASLDCDARSRFGPFDRLALCKQMEAVGWTEYPEATGHDIERASGDAVCDCGKAFREHPLDWRLIGYGDVPFANILCDGRRVKL